MIELITGKPGSGKTYLAVQRLLELPVGKYVIWHNIAGLKPEVFPEPHMIKEIPEDVRGWCSKENQIRYAEACREKYGRPMLVVIDEAQMVFGEKDVGLKGWLSWHRHIGQDIWLVAQHAKMIHQDYQVLVEYEVRAVRSVVLNMLVYQYRIGGETFKTARLRREARVFRAYRSFDQGEVSKPGFRMIIWLGVLLVLAVGGFVWLEYGIWGKAEVASVPKKEKVRQVMVGQHGAPGVLDVWDSVSFAGVIGAKVLVQSVAGGRLQDLGEVLGERYLVVDASCTRAVVQTASGRHTVRKRSLDGVGTEFLAGGESLPQEKRIAKKTGVDVSGPGHSNVDNGVRPHSWRRP